MGVCYIIVNFDTFAFTAYPFKGNRLMRSIENSPIHLWLIGNTAMEIFLSREPRTGCRMYPGLEMESHSIRSISCGLFYNNFLSPST